MIRTVVENEVEYAIKGALANLRLEEAQAELADIRLNGLISKCPI